MLGIGNFPCSTGYWLWYEHDWWYQPKGVPGSFSSVLYLGWFHYSVPLTSNLQPVTFVFVHFQPIESRSNSSLPTSLRICQRRRISCSTRRISNLRPTALRRRRNHRSYWEWDQTNRNYYRRYTSTWSD